MTRVFAYCRVSTSEQSTDNQVQEIKMAGFQIEDRRIISEAISGSIMAMSRPGFSKLFDRLEAGDVLIVTKLDRLGRSAIDVRSTVQLLEKQGVRVHCLALGGVDLTSPAGRMTMHVIAAVAEFERDLLIERTQAGLRRARAQGKHCGRLPVFDRLSELEIAKRLQAGESVSAIARNFKTSRQTIMRIRGRHSAEILDKN